MGELRQGSELRQRMLEDMRLAGLAETTQERYVRAARRPAKTFMRPPDEITEAEVRRYVLDLPDRRRCAEGTLRANGHGIRRLPSAMNTPTGYRLTARGCPAPAGLPWVTGAARTNPKGVAAKA